MTLTPKQLEAARLWRAAEGDSGALRSLGLTRAQAQFKLGESVAAGEFPTQIQPAIRRTLQKVYDNTPQKHQEFTTRKTVQAIDVDEEINVYKFDDQSNIPDENMGDKFIPGGLPAIGPRESYPQIGLSASGKKIRASKIGEAFGIDWEAIVRTRGTGVNLIRDAVEAFGRHAKNQEEIDVAKQLVKGNGFNTAALANAYAIPGNPDGTDPIALQTALGALLERTIDGVPVNYDSYTLLTSTANAPRFRQTLGSRRITRVPARTGSASANQSAQWEESLEFGAEIEVVGWKWLKAIWPQIGNGWLLLPKAAADDLPILTSNFLEGYETPSFWIKDSNARNLGGGEVNPEADGDFDSDAVQTKVRHVHGATALWTEGIGYSTGTNT